MRADALHYKKSKSRSREAGQSTLEFTLTLVLMIGFLFFYYRLTTVFAFGNYLHYAVFMSARAYLASGPDQKDQLARANEVMESMLGSNGDRYKMFATGDGTGNLGMPGLEIGEGPGFLANRNDGWAQGVRYRFQSKLFFFQLGRPAGGPGSAGRALAGGTPTNASNGITLQAESFLGREPSFEECDRQLTKRGASSGKIARYDNGC